jgi:hypothetical protein
MEPHRHSAAAHRARLWVLPAGRRSRPVDADNFLQSQGISNRSCAKERFM